MKKILILVVLFSGFAASSFAQATGTASASASIIKPISITWNRDLNFGVMAVNVGGGGTGGDVTLTPVDATVRSVSPIGGVTFPTGTSPTSAKFTVTGEPLSTYNITGFGLTVITDPVSTQTMAISFSRTPNGIGTLDAGPGTGTQIIYVGGTITVGASQVVGSYTGNFDVTVNYN